MAKTAVTDLLITGASGYLAHRLVPLACEVASVAAVSRHRPRVATLSSARWHSVDLLDAPTIIALITELGPRAIINVAAANPGAGESYAVNVDGAAAVARAVQTGARLVHVSSDIVHNGNEAPYADEAEPDPINDYGRSKADGEASVLATLPEAMVVRTSLIYSLDEMDRGTSGFARRLEAGEGLTLWGDAIRQPVFADALAAGLVQLALDLPNEAGTLNLAGEQSMSRAEFGRLLLAHWGVDTNAINESSASDVPGQPLDLTLSFTRARRLGLPIPGVAEVLA